MNSQINSNTTLLKGLCMALPAAVLVAAHYFPWRKVTGRELHQLQAYSIGTAAIVGTANLAISLSDGDRADHVAMLTMAAGSAGVATLAAHAVDAFLRLWDANHKQDAVIAGLTAQLEALKDGADL